MSARKAAESGGEDAASSGRPKNGYDRQDCPTSFDDLCKKLNKWADAWEVWGNDVLSELDDLKRRVGSTQPTEPGPGPTDATQPPSSPFKK